MPTNSECRLWFRYWRTAWQERRRSKGFSPYRAIPSVLTAVVQLFLYPRAHPLEETLIFCSIIMVVYVALYVIEAAFNTVVRYPASTDEQKSRKIRELKSVAYPEVPLELQRKAKLVRERLRNINHEGRKILREIMDSDGVDMTYLEAESGFSSVDVNKTLTEGFSAGVLEAAGNLVLVKPALAAALDHVLASEGL